MNILTPTEISECLTGGPTAVARAIEAATIAKLAAGVSVEPAYPAGSEGMLGEDCYTAEQMEAARLQGEQDAIKRLGTMSVEPEQVAARWPSVPGSHHYAGAGKCPPNSFGPDSEDLFTRNQLTTALAAARVAAINTCADEADRLEWDVCAFALRALIGTKT